MNTLPSDIELYIWKFYFDNNILPKVKRLGRQSSQKFQAKQYNIEYVLQQMKVHASGNYIATLINKFMRDHPDNFYVRNYSEQYWDTIYYILLNKHLQKKSDIFLFVDLKDVIQSLHT